MKACGITDVGLQRHENQDTFAVERGAADGQHIALEYDGMSSEPSEHLARSLAVHAIHTRPSNATRRSIRSVTAWGRRSSPP